MVETTRLEAGSAESTNSFRGKPQKPDLVTSFFLLGCSQQPFMSNCSQEIKITLDLYLEPCLKYPRKNKLLGIHLLNEPVLKS